MTRSLLVAAAAAVAVAAIILAPALFDKDSYGVTFVVEPSALELNGRQLFGHVQVVISTPNGPITKDYNISGSRQLVIHVSIPERVVEEWMEFYKEFENYAGKTGVKAPGKPLPTVSLVFYLYDDQGNSYTGAFSFSTVTYLMMFKKTPLDKAVEMASENPFLAFTKKPVVTLRSPVEIGLRKVGDMAPPIVKEMLKEAEERRADLSKPLVATAYTASTGQCTPYTLVWFEELYDAAYNPPKGGDNES
ncbi:hypothetical protein [Hyperthermus butylicus]|uniref:Uncharacterized protein n=1 Tax=Hyperthermus butylicus (strain DSM 5456 / JCM 9403 / PLM1-5) TaxID=415426 RepID=A2BJQ1_HYPBU|nr:hypothetical protein [Hyperthermus butylicus]ABM80212.1 hypothetical protein Hbut_0340 [Hyperthermus butylicus DSM 5456]